MDDASTAAAPCRVSLAPFTPSASRRFSSRFIDPVRMTPAAKRPLAWVSLQGRLIGAENATSATSIGGGLSVEEAAGWELFHPLHRVLIVAIVAAAARESKRSGTIRQLQRSVELRDQVLESMQQKLEDLFEQMNSTKDQSANCVSYSEIQVMKGAKFANSEQLLELNPESGITPLHRNPSFRMKDFDGSESGGDDIFKINQHEERRMSDLSDICSSVTSSVDIQLSSLAAEQEIYNLRKECEEKDAAIKGLSAAYVTRAADAKRITELEEIIRRKNLVITKLKKDMVVLEQKVIQLTRERRSSTAPKLNIAKIPAMANNLLYDMSSTSPSSSDSDSPSNNRECHSQGSVASFISEGHKSKTIQNRGQLSVKSLGSLDEPRDRPTKQHSVSPSNNIRRGDPSVALRANRMVSSGGDFKKSKRHTQQESKSAAAQRRWV